MTVKPEPCLFKSVALDDAKPKGDVLAGTPPKTNSLTVQLGDALLDVFKNFTDRH
jgi:hypothetical protein